MNEYIELAKFYSTPKSATFINGVLDTLMPQMVEEGKIKKVGRGLIG
jgi:N utilization substance protein B